MPGFEGRWHSSGTRYTIVPRRRQHHIKFQNTLQIVLYDLLKPGVAILSIGHIGPHAPPRTQEELHADSCSHPPHTTFFPLIPYPTNFNPIRSSKFLFLFPSLTRTLLYIWAHLTVPHPKEVSSERKSGESGMLPSHLKQHRATRLLPNTWQQLPTTFCPVL